MKFGTKLTLFIIAVISIVLSCSRFLMVRQNFIHAIENSANQNANGYAIERYYLESSMINAIQLGEEITNEKMIENVKSLYSYMGDSLESIAIYTEKEEKIFSNFEAIDNINIKELLDKETDSYCLKEIEEKQYMLFSSYFSIHNEKIYMVHIYDITSLYEQRDSQMREIMVVDFIILLISSAFISIFSTFLTKPIKRLNETSKKIASGHFEERVNIGTDDEIGELANSFNTMAEQIEHKIEFLNLSIKQKNDFITRIYP